MKIKVSRLQEITTQLIIALLMLGLGSYNSSAQAIFSLKSFIGSVQGTSNIRDWKSDINQIECKGLPHYEGQKLESIKNVELKILVESIKGKEGESMDRKTYEAFKYDKYPYITYTFITALVKMEDKNNITIDPWGDLTMAGTTKHVLFSAKGTVLPNGDLHLYVSKKLNLRAYDIEPPTAMLGAVKVSEEIVLNLELVLTLTKK